MSARHPFIRTLLIGILFLATAGGVCLASEVSDEASSTFNGLAWRRLEKISIEDESTRMFKVCMIRGVYEGAYAMDPENALEQYGPWVSFGKLAESLDRFYAEDRNTRIPVTQALVLIARNAEGPVPTPVKAPAARSKALVSMETH